MMNTLIQSFNELLHFAKVSALGQQVFSGCSTLSIINTTNITSATYQFINGTLIPEIKFPVGFTTLGVYSFYANFAIRLIDLPESMATIGNMCFNANINLVLVCRAATPPSLGSSNNSPIAIYVPDNSIEAYKTNWSALANKIHPMSEYEGEL